MNKITSNAIDFYFLSGIIIINYENVAKNTECNQEVGVI